MYRWKVWPQVFKDSWSDYGRAVAENNKKVAGLCSNLMEQCQRTLDLSERHLVCDIAELESTRFAVREMYYLSLPASSEVKASVQVLDFILADIVHDNKYLKSIRRMSRNDFYEFVLESLNLIYAYAVSNNAISKPRFFSSSRFVKDVSRYAVGENRDSFEFRKVLIEEHPLSYVFIDFYYKCIDVFGRDFLFLRKSFFKFMDHNNSVLLTGMLPNKIAYPSSFRVNNASKAIIDGELDIVISIGAVRAWSTTGEGFFSIYYTVGTYSRIIASDDVVSCLSDKFSGMDVKVNVVDDYLNIYSVSVRESDLSDFFKQKVESIEYTLHLMKGGKASTFYLRHLFWKIFSLMATPFVAVESRIRSSLSYDDFHTKKY